MPALKVHPSESREDPNNAPLCRGFHHRTPYRDSTAAHPSWTLTGFPLPRAGFPWHGSGRGQWAIHIGRGLACYACIVGVHGRGGLSGSCGRGLARYACIVGVHGRRRRRGRARGRCQEWTGVGAVVGVSVGVAVGVGVVVTVGRRRPGLLAASAVIMITVNKINGCYLLMKS